MISGKIVFGEAKERVKSPTQAEPAARCLSGRLLVSLPVPQGLVLGSFGRERVLWTVHRLLREHVP